MDCIKTEELLSEYIEDELSEKLHLEIETHLEHCQSCNKLCNSLKEIINIGPKLQEDVPFYLKNRLLYIPELIELQKEEPSTNQGLKFIAAMIGTAILLLNVFYFTNIYPEGNYFLHKTMSKIERFAIDTKEYVLQKDSVKNNILISFLDKNVFADDEKDFISWNGENGEGNG